jgi:hypothetical protein
MKTTNKKIYVTMTDKFMSGWGMAENMINKYIIICDTLEEARTIERNAKKRNEMKYINIKRDKPYFNPKKYLLTFENYSELGEIWKR